MAVLTSNLKLRIDDTLTAVAKSNLYKIDTLGSLYQVDTNADARIRSQRNILIQPQDPDVGGTGSGGSVSIGTAEQPVTSLNVFTDTLNLTADITTSGDLETSGCLRLTNGVYDVCLQAPTLSSSYTLTLPTNDGEPNQVLGTDGLGNLSWKTVEGAGSGNGQELAVSWLAAEGTVKTVTHNFGTRNIMVQVIDPNDSYRNIDVDEVLRPTDNTLVLDSSSAPAVSWTILLKEIN